MWACAGVRARVCGGVQREGPCQSTCACMCPGEIQGSVIPANGRVRTSLFRGSKEHGRRCGCTHVCKSGRVEGHRKARVHFCILEVC